MCCYCFFFLLSLMYPLRKCTNSYEMYQGRRDNGLIRMGQMKNGQHSRNSTNLSWANWEMLPIWITDEIQIDFILSGAHETKKNTSDSVIKVVLRNVINGMTTFFSLSLSQQTYYRAICDNNLLLMHDLNIIFGYQNSRLDSSYQSQLQLQFTLMINSDSSK